MSTRVPGSSAPPLPPDAAESDGWEPKGYRVILGTWHGTDIEPQAVRASCHQHRDGHISEALVHIDLRDDYGGITSADARRLASALIDAADQADAWSGRPISDVR